MDHDILAKAEAYYYTHSDFRKKVEDVVTVMTNATSHDIDSAQIRINRVLFRTTAMVTLYMQKDHDG